MEWVLWWGWVLANESFRFVCADITVETDREAGAIIVTLKITEEENHWVNEENPKIVVVVWKVNNVKEQEDILAVDECDKGLKEQLLERHGGNR